MAADVEAELVELEEDGQGLGSNGMVRSRQLRQRMVTSSWPSEFELC